MADALLMDLEALKCNKSSLISAVKFNFVEKFSAGFDRPYKDSDFTKTKEGRESHTNSIKIVIKNLADSSNIEHDDNNELYAAIFVLCGENATIQPWNNELIVQNCQDVLSAILKISKCCDAAQLISKNVRLVNETLKLLSPKLLPSNWKHFPASVACFKWFLHNIKQPVLGSHLRFLLPPSLLLVDDFINENKIIGVQCLNHIVQNVVTAELKYYNHGDVIYNAIFPILRIKEADLLFLTIPLIISLTCKLEFDFSSQNETKWTRFETVLEILLENMELEQMIQLRTCYITHLSFIIDCGKQRIVRWSKRLLRIFEEYVHFAAKYKDDKTMRLCVKVIEKYLKYSEDVIPLHDKKLFCILLVALLFTCNFPSEFQAENKLTLLRCIRIILKTMSKSSYEDFKVELKEIFKKKNQYSKYQEIMTVIEEFNYNVNL